MHDVRTDGKRVPRFQYRIPVCICVCVCVCVCVCFSMIIRTNEQTTNTAQNECCFQTREIDAKDLSPHVLCAAVHKSWPRDTRDLVPHGRSIINRDKIKKRLSLTHSFRDQSTRAVSNKRLSPTRPLGDQPGRYQTNDSVPHTLLEINQPGRYQTQYSGLTRPWTGPQRSGPVPRHHRGGRHGESPG